MKKAFYVLACMLFVLVVLLPFGALLSFCFGYTFELTSVSVSVFTVAIALLSVCLVVMSIRVKASAENVTVKVMFALLAPLSLIYAIFCMLKCGRIWVIAAVFICIGCCLFLTIKHAMPFALKITALALSAIMVLPIGFFVFIILIFGKMGQNTVVKTVESPNKAYYAEVIDSDQGALGGNTLVDVYENKEINALDFKICKKPKRVYLGDWGEFGNMKIYWKDDNCLVINSVEYEIE